MKKKHHGAKELLGAGGMHTVALRALKYAWIAGGSLRPRCTLSP